jgi:hypothetical protein
MEHLSSDMEQQNQEQQMIQWSRDKYKSFAAKDTSISEIQR